MRFMAAGTFGFREQLVAVNDRQILLLGRVAVETEAGLILFQVAGRDLVAVACGRDFPAIQVACQAPPFERTVGIFLPQRHSDRIVALKAHSVHWVIFLLGSGQKYTHSQEERDKDCTQEHI